MRPPTFSVPSAVVGTSVEASARHERTACGDGSMVWRVWGDGDPLVLLHGATGSWNHWLLNIPALAGRFQQALFFPGEAHLDPRRALSLLRQKLVERGVVFTSQTEDDRGNGLTADCTGAAKIGCIDGLRGVRGEMLCLQTGEVKLSRPVRLIHPRIPLYIVPRGNGLFMCGATMIETDDGGPITARSLMELLNAAYALHPAFGEARLVETGTGVRPAFADNLPRVMRAR